MYKRGLTREQANEIAVTNRVTSPSPAVTGPIVIPQGPKLRHSWTFDERFQVPADALRRGEGVDIEERLGPRVGHRSIRALDRDHDAHAAAQGR
jgi:hypothetical protein